MTEQLQKELLTEVESKTKQLARRIERIKKDLEELSEEAQTLHEYFQMTKNFPLQELANATKLSGKEINNIKRACKLTKNSPYVNRSLCKRFSILP